MVYLSYSWKKEKFKTRIYMDTRTERLMTERLMTERLINRTPNVTERLIFERLMTEHLTWLNT